MKKCALLILFLTFFVFLFAQTPEQVMKYRINYKIIREEHYINKKLIRADTTIFYFDRHGRDSVQRSTYGMDYTSRYFYNTNGWPVKKIGSLGDSLKLDSSVYNYHDNGTYEQLVFYYDPKFSSSTITYNNRNQRTSVLDNKGEPLDEYFYDPTGRKIKTIIHRKNGKIITRDENQTLDKDGRLLIDNRQAYGGSYYIYQYDDRGLITQLTVYLDKKRTRKLIYKTTYFYY